jgi:hypothetical protein
MKTELVLSLIERRLAALMEKWNKGGRKGRKPHLVTCEDNIEKYFLELPNLQALESPHGNADPGYAKSLWLSDPAYPDYTPRMRYKDTENLEEAVNAALRMTPAVFYAGEIRDPKDWIHLYRLAQSHVVALTTHASSLTNTFFLLQRSLRIGTAAQRSALAASIHSVIHMKPGQGSLKRTLRYKESGKNPIEISEIKWVLPACWTRTALSVAAYTADGASSLTPENITIPDRGDVYCVGRQSFAAAWQRYALDEAGYAAPTKRWTSPKTKVEQATVFDELRHVDSDENRKAAMLGLARLEKSRPVPFTYQKHKTVLPEFFHSEISTPFFDELIEGAISLDLQGE